MYQLANTEIGNINSDADACITQTLNLLCKVYVELLVSHIFNNIQ